METFRTPIDKYFNKWTNVTFVQIWSSWPHCFIWFQIMKKVNYNIKVKIIFKGIPTMNCVLLSFLSWFSRKLHTRFLLFFLKNPALLGVFDVHHKHSKACEGRRNNPLEYTEAKLKTFRFSSYFHSGKQKSRNGHRLEETTSKQTNLALTTFSVCLPCTFLLSPCGSNEASEIQAWSITLLDVSDQ